VSYEWLATRHKLHQARHAQSKKTGKPNKLNLSTNETDRYDITEILLKVTLNTITLIETLNLLTERHFI
jgi:hypothetical protein